MENERNFESDPLNIFKVSKNVASLKSGLKTMDELEFLIIYEILCRTHQVEINIEQSGILIYHGYLHNCV